MLAARQAIRSVATPELVRTVTVRYLAPMRIRNFFWLAALLSIALGCGAPQTVAPTRNAPTDNGLTVRVTALAQTAKLHGWVLVSQGERVLVSTGIGTITPTTKAGFAVEHRWTLASITKQILAVLMMQAAERGLVALDQPVRSYLPSFTSANATVTVRQLLRHQTGYPNPDDSPKDSVGVPALYSAATPAPDMLAYCGSAITGPSGAAWSYNNCDYTVAVALLEQVTGKPWATHIAELNKTLHTSFSDHGDRIAGYEGLVSDQGLFDFARYKGAGDLTGSIMDMLTFDRALLSGTLLSAASRAQLWESQAELGFIAIGQWSFPVALSACQREVRIIERRGAFGHIGVRNVLVPELDLVIIAFNNRAEVDFGEPWSGQGLTHELLSAVICKP